MEEVVEEIKKECNLRERVLLKIFAKTFVKVYHIGRIDCFNNLKNKKLNIFLQ